MTIPTEAPVIEVRSIGKSFGSTVAVDDVSFSVNAGEVLALLGPNGAGKTTTVRMLTTLLQIERGSAAIAGRDIATEPDAVRRVIGLAGQSAAVDEKLTARENLELFSRLYKVPRRTRHARIRDLIERFDMTEFADRPASTYSGGQRRRLDIVASLVAEPLALFLDEPTTGLDPRSRAELWDAVRELAAGGTAMVLTTQYLDEADALADQIQVIDRGSVVASGTPASLKKSVGLDTLEVNLAEDRDVRPASRALAGMDGVTVEASRRRVDVAISGGTAQSLDVLRRLQGASVSIADFELRRPTLDDAFLALTGTLSTDALSADTPESAIPEEATR